MNQIPRTDASRINAATCRYGNTYEEYMVMVNGLIQYVTESFDSEDFADTVFTLDAWEDGVNPADTAEDILMGDDIGAQWLEAFKQGEL